MASLEDYKLFGKTGLRVSPLCLGTMTFGTEWGWGADEATARRIFDTYLDHGGNFIDTAVAYTNGTSETFVGKFAKAKRDRLVLSTKFGVAFDPENVNSGGNGRKAIRLAVETSLKRLQTDYIDIFWLHMWDGRTAPEDVLRALDDLQRQGKILHAAASDTPAWIVAHANALAESKNVLSFCGIQSEYSLIERTPDRDLLPASRALELAFQPWSPLGGGLLTGKYSSDELGAPLSDTKNGRLAWIKRDGRVSERSIAIVTAVEQVANDFGVSASQVAIAWVLSQTGVVSPIIAGTSESQIESNLAALELELSDEHRAGLSRASAVPGGFPHDFIQSDAVAGMMSAGSKVAQRQHWEVR